MAFDGRQAARDFVRIQENQLAIDAPDVLQLQYFQLPNGTFSYTDLPVPATFTGMLLPYGKATATREFVARGPAFEMPEPWSAPGIASDRMHDSAFFPGDDGELLGSGASVLEAWAELLNRSQDVSPDDQECVTVVSVRNAGRADGYVGDLGEFNFTNFAFIVQAEDELGVRHSIDVNDHWVRGREWFLQEPQATVSYGQCLDREIARPAAVNLSGFLQRTKSMPLMGETRGMSASYWTDDVQPFGLPHDRLRFSKSFAVDAGWTPYVEMDAASGAWYRWFGATEAMEELGLFQPN